MKRFTGIYLAAALIRIASAALGADAAAPSDKAEASPPAQRLTVAVLDFEASDPANAKLGEDIAAALTAMLCDQPGVALVERRSLIHVMQEHELSLSGLVDSRQAVKIGKFVGAQIIVTGRAFRLGKELFITARLIGTNTSLIEGVLIKDGANADFGTLVEKLSGKVAEKLRSSGPKLIDRPELPDPLPGLKRKLAERRLPAVAVLIREEHQSALAENKERAALGSTVETEVQRLLLECGFTVREVPALQRGELTKDGKPIDIKSWPASLNGVDVLISGDAFSEYGTRIGNLVTCSSRAEASVLLRDGTLLHAVRVIERGADLSEEISAKKALQNAGRELGVEILAQVVEKLPKK